jgi:hypothetical protein
LYHNDRKNPGNFSRTAPVNMSNRTSCFVMNGYAIITEKTQETPEENLLDFRKAFAHYRFQFVLPNYCLSHN